MLSTGFQLSFQKKNRKNLVFPTTRGYVGALKLPIEVCGQNAVEMQENIAQFNTLWSKI